MKLNFAKDYLVPGLFAAGIIIIFILVAVIRSC
jgi:hypothetical protein